MKAGWLGVVWAIGACGGDSGGNDPVVSVPCDPAVDGRGQPYACIGGALVSESGEPVVGVRVAACTMTTCIMSNSGADGSFVIQRLPVEPQRVDILGVAKGYMALVYYQDIVPGEVARASRPLVVPTLKNETVAWGADGGEVAVADGKLVMTAKAGALSYPVGTPESEMLVEAVAVPIADLVPYDIEPWKGKVSKSMAFVVNPFPLTATESIGLTVKGVGAASNARYTLYTADHLTAELTEAGVLEANAAGDLVLQPGATFTQLTTLVIVPN